MIRYFNRAFLTVFIPFAVILGLLVFAGFKTEVRAAETAARRLTETYWKFASDAFSSFVSGGNAAPAADEFFLLEKNEGVRVTFIDFKGRILFDSLETSGAGQKFREELRSALKGESYYSVKKHASSFSAVYASVLGQSAVLRIETDGRFYTAAYNRARRNAATLAAVFFVILTAVSLTVAWFSVKPAVRLAAVRRAVARGADGFTMPKISDPLLNEAASLMYRINRIRLKEKRGREREARLLKSIINHIDEGVVLIGGDGVVLESNRRARAVFADGVRKGVAVCEIPSDYEAAAFFQEICGRENGVFRLPFKEHPYEIYTKQIDSNRLIVLRDVSVQSAYEEFKTELTANVAHEMKTPLAVIMGTAETILGDVQMDESTRRRFLEKLYRSAARLNRFIDQTLELYRLESTGVSVEEPTAIETVIAQSVLNPSDKIVRYDNRTTRAFLIDAFHTEMILSNLINNAVKYSTAKEIDVKIEEQDGALILEVADGGPLIPEKDRKRIFERFYTVSKSRQKSGFGLGLSIVKHIAGLYDGEATVFENERGGNTFRIVLHEKKKREIT